ncbi:hypothetical protein [Pseudoroseicyclus sp. CXY001]|uniref:hypothetical protein n=1 Tax=Pseudoroseicyclus sp. CXY001 TaxID=3242492 RepID=UPI0035717734
MPNAFAQLMLLAWPFASLALFRALAPGRALIASMLIAYLVLPPAPAGVDLPLLPPLTKDTIPALVAFLIVIVMHREGLRLWPRNRLAQGLILVFVFSPVLTVIANPQPIIAGSWVTPGLTSHDAIAWTVNQALVLLPFLMARALLASPGDHRDLLFATLIAGLAYSLPLLLEVRLSPILNLRLYGYYQHAIAQSVRGDGFRPLVFLQHGLWAAFLVMSSVLAAVALARAEEGSRRVALLFAGFYMLVVLVLCKSLASLLYALAGVPLILMLPQRWHIHIAAALACLTLVYPAAKAVNLVPEQALLAAAADISPDRAQSLGFRFENEALLLQRAEERPLLGWGGWGRHLVRDSQTGQQISVSDGQWIVTLGTWGWLGFIAQFGILVLPILAIWGRMIRFGPETLAPLVGPILLLYGINLVDLIPNATLTPVTWLIAGGMLGYSEGSAAASVSAPQGARRPAPIRTVL